ncbi:MAG: hypothetical protein K1X56_03925 [Flavobacteriales bacterium]|nr:hypothetical protein [Flavobacteriales bacterium]
MNWIGLITVFFLGATKFLFAPSAALGAGFTTWETVILVAVSGLFGVSFFYLGADSIISWSQNRRKKKDQQKREAGIVVVRKVFTPFKRKVVRIKNRFGIIGIAIVTPCIISIPIGSILAARFFPNKIKTLTALFISTIGWAFILTFLNDQVMKLINTLFG